jgi:hypothetical protein
VNYLNALFRVIQSLRVVLRLREYCAQLKLELAFLPQLFHADRHTVLACILIERLCIWLRQDSQALFQVDVALLEHAKFLVAHGHIMKCRVGNVSVSLGAVQADHLGKGLKIHLALHQERPPSSVGESRLSRSSPSVCSCTRRPPARTVRQVSPPG